MIYALSLIVSFISVALKGFQHKNVIGHHLKATFITSFAMAGFDVLAITVVIQGDWKIALTAGTGGAFGMIFSMLFHEKLFSMLYKEECNDSEN